MNVAVVGTGSTQLVTAACLAEAGHHVTCADPEGAWHRALGGAERDLAELVRRNVWEQRLSFAPSIRDATPGAEAVFVGCAARGAGDATSDVRTLLDDAAEVARHAARDAVVVIRSAVPVGTAEQVAEAVRAAELHVVSNPDFLADGAAVDEFLCPDRVVVGASSERARSVMERLYAPFPRRRSRVVFMDPRSAELTATAARAMRAARDALMTELVATCARLGADLDQVRRGLALER